MALTTSELVSALTGVPLLMSVELADGQSFVVEVDASTTAAEVVSSIAKVCGLTKPDGYTLAVWSKGQERVVQLF